MDWRLRMLQACGPGVLSGIRLGDWLRLLREHGGFPGYYVVLSLLTFYPWSALLPPALGGGWLRRRDDPAMGFLLGWIAGPLVFLELVRTKLIHSTCLPIRPARCWSPGWS